MGFQVKYIERTKIDTFLRNTIFWTSFYENYCERIAFS